MGVQTRGYRNKNPGNIRKTWRDAWQGMAPAAEQNDPEFLVFSEHKYGVRAISVLIRNYQTIYGLKSIREIINRYAPPAENFTSAYVLHVSALMGVSPNDPVDVVNNHKERADLVSAIIAHENGYVMYSTEEISAWVML